MEKVSRNMGFGQQQGNDPDRPDNTQDADSGQGSMSIASIKELGSQDVPNTKSNNIHCLTIIGQIEGHIVLPPQNKTTKYEHIMPQLVAIEESTEIEGLLLILNTVGGDVEAGLAISEMISTMSKPSVSLVLGGGHSIGVPLSVCTDYSFIVPTATMTIHPIRMTGLVIGGPQTYEYFNKMQERISNFITDHTKIPKDKLNELIFRTGGLANDVGTILIGEEAVANGLIDEVGGLKSALDKLKELIAQKRGA